MTSHIWLSPRPTRTSTLSVACVASMRAYMPSPLLFWGVDVRALDIGLPFIFTFDHRFQWLSLDNIKRERLALSLCSCSKTEVDPMELSVKQNVTTSSVLLKSSTQYSSVQPHTFKFHINWSISYQLRGSNKNVSSSAPYDIQTLSNTCVCTTILTLAFQCY